MGSKIFLSCGQSNDRERRAAARLKDELINQGFDVYVAIRAQSIQDVNSGIINELKRSDYYVFVDFRREKLGGCASREYRGSLFTHQELAIATVSGFERVLFFREKGVKLEGLMRYMGANAIPFDSEEDLVNALAAAFRERAWRTDYSRHLIAAKLTWSATSISVPWFGNTWFSGYFLFLDIENRRRDQAAFDTIARLEFIQPAGSKRRQPATTRQPVQHLAGMVVRAAQDSHGLVNGHHGLFLPFEVEDQPGFQVRQRSRHEQHLNE